MKHFLLSLAFFTLCTSESLAQYVLSPRVGEIIDQNEREYFGLFPAIEGYVSAKASVRGDHQVAFVITRSQRGVSADTSLTVSSSVADNLVDYIENFESVLATKDRLNGNLLGGLAASGSVIESEIHTDADAKIETRYGEALQGKLLWADDSSLIVWQSSDSYNWRTIQNVRAIRSSDMTSITIEQEDAFWQGAEYGALIGGGGGAVMGALFASAFKGNDLLAYAAVGGLFGAVCTGLVGGIVGGVLSSDIHRWIGGNVEEYRATLSLLKEHAIFSSLPPELQHFEDSTNSDGITRPVAGVRQATPLEEPSVRNSLYVEFFGNGHLFSFNYERRFFENVAVRIGCGEMYIDEVSIPILAYYLLNFGASNIQLGAGVGLLPSGYQGQNIYLTSNVGYRYQPKEGGYMFELAFAPILIIYDRLIPWFGLGFGYAF